VDLLDELDLGAGLAARTSWATIHTSPMTLRISAKARAKGPPRRSCSGSLATLNETPADWAALAKWAAWRMLTALLPQGRPAAR
jgi:hypothetical protein